MDYVDPGASFYEARYRARVIENLHRRAKSPSEQFESDINGLQKHGTEILAELGAFAFHPGILQM